MENNRQLWVVEQFVGGFVDGRKNEYEKGKSVFEMQGIFDSEEKAIAACRNERYYIYPLNLNEPLPDESVDIVDGYYPLLSKGGFE